MKVATTTRTITVNRAFLQEIKEVNQELWELLASTRYLCTRPISIRTQSRHFLEQLAELRDQLALHFALEEAYGYFEDPVWVAPQLCRAADELRQDHARLYLWICEIAENAERFQRSGMIASLLTDVASEFESFHASLLEHEQREQELILSEYDDDLGVGD